MVELLHRCKQSFYQPPKICPSYSSHQPTFCGRNVSPMLTILYTHLLPRYLSILQFVPTHLLWSNCSTNPGGPCAILSTSITQRSDWKLAYSLMSDIGCGASGMVPVSASMPVQTQQQFRYGRTHTVGRASRVFSSTLCPNISQVKAGRGTSGCLA